MEIALSKSILQHHILNTTQYISPIISIIIELRKKKKQFHKQKKKHQIYEDKNWTRGLVGGNSKYLH